jgi:hypothetical protein
MLTGLLLGAGASYESGLPLVWELTNALRSILTPKVPRDKNERSKKYNSGHPDHVIEYMILDACRPSCCRSARLTVPPAAPRQMLRGRENAI